MSRDLDERYYIYTIFLEMLGQHIVEEDRKESELNQASAELGSEEAANKAIFEAVEATSEFTLMSRFNAYMAGKLIEDTLAEQPVAHSVEEFTAYGLDRIIDDEFIDEILSRIAAISKKDGNSDN